jgi:hypothetical protein
MEKSEIIELAELFSKDMEVSFRKQINASYSIVSMGLKPEERNAALLEQFNVFTDYLIGTTVGLLSVYGSIDENFEKHVIHEVQDKFRRLRELNLKKGDPQ